MEPQIFDQLVEDSWLAEPSRSNPVNTTSDLWPNYLWLNEYDPLAYKFEDLQSLDDLESGFNLPNSSSPPAFELLSPISDSSSLSVEDPFDEKPLINPWDIPTAVNNNTINPTAPCSPASGENSPAIEIPELALSLGSSGSNSPRDIQHDIGTKKPTKRDRKHSSENCRAKSSGSNRRNAHNLIEKKYRNNLNSKIQALHDSIPSENEEGADGMDSDADERKKVQKCNKGVILDKAVKYIAKLEKQVERISKENAGLQLMIEGSLDSYLYASGVRCKGVAQGHMPRKW